MTLRVIGVHPSGSAYVYHVARTADGASEECFRISRIRRDSKAIYLTCEIHDAVTTIPRSDANADHREVQALIDAGTVTPVLHPENIPLDPLQAGKDDGVAGIPAVIAQDTAGRQALRETLRAAHIDKRPAGTRFQRRLGNVLEVHEDDGSGTTVVRETWDVNADGRMTRRR